MDKAELSEDQAKEIQDLLEEDAFEITDDDDILFPPEEDLYEYHIATGRENHEGVPLKMHLVLRNPRSPLMASDFISNMQNPRALANACKVMVVKPRKLVDERPVVIRKDGEGFLYRTEDGKETRDLDRAEKQPGILLASSAIQNSVRMKILKALGVTEDFFADFVTFNTNLTKSVLRKSSTRSPKPTGSGQQNDSSTKPETTATPSPASQPNSPSHSPTSVKENSPRSEPSPKVSPPVMRIQTTDPTVTARGPSP
jgi:hypothetical protein